VGEDQREGAGLGGPDVQEVDALAVDRGGELRVGVEPRLDGEPPVEAVLPVTDEAPQVRQGHAVRPSGRREPGRLVRIGRELVGPPGGRQPGGQVVEVGLRYLGAERADRGLPLRVGALRVFAHEATLGVY